MPKPLTSTDPPAPVTTVDTRVIVAGRGDAFAGWMDELRQVIARQPGQRDGTMLLAQRGGFAHLLYRFDSRRALDAWLASAACQRLDAQAQDFSLLRRQIGMGDHPQINLPNEATASKWRRALLTWATVTPLLLCLNALTQATIASWPRPLSLALSSAVLTMLLTWIVLPWITRRAQTWVMRAVDGSVRQGDG